MLSFNPGFDLHQVHATREVNAAVVNISGRQRMLSQRTAFFALQLVCSRTTFERQQLRQTLLGAIALMEESHQGLLFGNPSLKLPGRLSPTLKTLYFEPPLHLDQQVQHYIREVRAIAEAPDEQLTLDNPHLQSVLGAASQKLLEALDRVVSKYKQESEAEQLALDLSQVELFQQRDAAMAEAQQQAQKLEQMLLELQRTQTQLVQTEKMSSLGQLVAGIAHEINNPVNFIYGNLKHALDYTNDLLELIYLYHQAYPTPETAIAEQIQAIDLEFLSQDLPKLLGSIQMGAERIREIVLSLRNFSRQDDTTMELANLHEGIDSTLLILQHRLKPSHNHPGIQVIKEYGDLPLVECHLGQMNQVFMNLLSNAIDALKSDCPPSAVCCNVQEPAKIRIYTELRPPNTVLICIADNGPGIPETVKSRLFDPFFTTKPVGQGTGIGLSISQQIVVDTHRGDLWCTAGAQGGAEFWIELPIHQYA